MTFADIIGHNTLKQQLSDMAGSGKMGHALLFWGEEGVGALPLALALAQFLVCRSLENGDACGKCPSCNKMQKLIHPDLHFAVPVNSVKPSDRNPVTAHYANKWIEAVLDNPYLSENQWYERLGIDNKSGNISVHEADAILKALSFKAYEGEHKFMIIWMPERMNIQAANSLLKILEEPPRGTHFFLVCEQPEQLLSTIRSRCQLIRVNPLPIDELVPALRSRLLLSEPDARLLARLSGGCFGRACALQEENENQEALDEQFSLLMNSCIENNALQLILWADDMAALGKERQRQSLLHALGLLRELYIESLRSPGVSYTSQAMQPQLHLWASRCPEAFFPAASQILNEALSDLGRNVNAKMNFYTVAFSFLLSLHRPKA